MNWISVKDRMPEDGILVIAYAPSPAPFVGRVFEALYQNDDGYYHSESNTTMPASFVTHWMPWPKPPEEV